jgi:hypothetical protein
MYRQLHRAKHRVECILQDCLYLFEVFHVVTSLIMLMCAVHAQWHGLLYTALAGRQLAS